MINIRTGWINGDGKVHSKVTVLLESEMKKTVGVASFWMDTQMIAYRRHTLAILGRLEMAIDNTSLGYWWRFKKKGINSYKCEMGMCDVSFTKVLEGVQDLRIRKSILFHILPELTLKTFSFKKWESRKLNIVLCAISTLERYTKRKYDKRYQWLYRQRP